MMAKSCEFEEALKATGFGKFNIALILICGACLFTVNTDSYSTGYLLPSAQCDLNLTTTHKGIFSSISFMGIICSSHLWGFLADTNGRKIIIIVTLFLSFLCTLIASFSANFWILIIMRFISGFFISGASAAVYVYLGEFHEVKYRTLSITCASLLVAVAIAALPGLAWLIIPAEWSIEILGLLTYKPWRFYLMLCSLPSVFVAGILMFLPESPKFLLLRGEHDQALAVLRKVYAFNTGKRSTDFPIQIISDLDNEGVTIHHKNVLQSMWIQTAPLFQKTHLFNTFIVCTVQFGLFAVSSGFLLWYPEIVNQMAEHTKLFPNSSITVCEAISFAKTTTDNEPECSDGIDTNVYEQNLIIGVAYILGLSGLSLIIKLFGKRTLLIIFLVISGGSGIAICWITNRLVVDYLFVGLLVLSGIGVCVVNAAVVELFPTYLRAMAMCISLMCGRLGSVIASSMIGILLELNCFATFVTGTTILLVCAVLCWWIPNEPSTDEKSTSL